jgi:hypothetical protein
VVRSGVSEPLTAAISELPAARALFSNSLDFGGAQERVRHWTLPPQSPLYSLSQPALLFPLLYSP